MAEFSGFNYNANWFKTPDDVFLLTDRYDPTTIIVLIYIIRHTWGFGNYDSGIRLTQEEIATGRRRSDNSKMDNGCNLTRQTVSKAIKRLVEDGVIETTKHNLGNGRYILTYRVRVNTQHNPDAKAENDNDDAEAVQLSYIATDKMQDSTIVDNTYSQHCLQNHSAEYADADDAEIEADRECDVTTEYYQQRDEQCKNSLHQLKTLSCYKADFFATQKNQLSVIRKKTTEENQQQSEILPQTALEIWLFTALQDNARARGRRGVQKFHSLEQARAFRKAADVLGEENSKIVIKNALVTGITALGRLVQYLTAAEENALRERKKSEMVHGNASSVPKPSPGTVCNTPVYSDGLRYFDEHGHPVIQRGDKYFYE